MTSKSGSSPCAKASKVTPDPQRVLAIDYPYGEPGRKGGPGLAFMCHNDVLNFVCHRIATDGKNAG